MRKPKSFSQPMIQVCWTWIFSAEIKFGFTELKKEDRSTDLFPRGDQNVRKDKKFGKGYIAGQYGAIPMLNLNFADIVSGLE